MPGTRVTQRCRPTTWTVAAATPTTGDPAAEAAAGEPAEPDAGRRHQGGADDQDDEPGHHRALVLAEQGEDVGGRLLEDLRVLEDRAERR